MAALKRPHESGVGGGVTWLGHPSCVWCGRPAVFKVLPWGWLCRKDARLAEDFEDDQA